MRFCTIKKSYLVYLVCISSFIVGYFFWINFQRTSKVVNMILPASIYRNKIFSTSKTSHAKIPLFHGYNGTHLWSWKLADEHYSEVSNEIPCGTVIYAGGSVLDKINSCDKSTTNEFSLPNLLQGQKWIYEHQHPVDCTNKRFAIIHKTAPSGFGSTVHQIAWAFAVALSQDRIAVYKSPGNWVYIRRLVFM